MSSLRAAGLAPMRQRLDPIHQGRPFHRPAKRRQSGAMPSVEPSSLPAHRATSLSTWVQAVKRAVEGKGVDAQALMLEAGMDLSLLKDPLARYPVHQTMVFWQRAIEATGEPLLGLDVARQITPMTFHALGYAGLASQNLADLFTRLSRYFRVVSDAGELSFERVGRAGCLRVSGDARVLAEADAQAAWGPVDAFMSVILRACGALYGPDFQLLELRLQRPRPQDHQRYERVLRVVPIYGSQDNALWLDESVLMRPLAYANEELARINEEAVGRYLSQWRQGQADDLPLRMREWFGARLPQGEPRQEDAAAHLGLSTRSLQRRLAEQGTSYRDVLQQARHALALAHLRAGVYSVSEIAYLLGFAELSAFTRAFRRWTGVTPSAWRDSPDA
ncbi:AraC family transcriptional regulator [Aquabacterium soli]|uniref:AraC family transcriptional regulator n=2 Tax=Aquabacterium soli TaxID=2493092 RepID=A0A3R8T864_9BURK|nr:AraC family transcriptional regulator [Aquabacterium soli]